VLVQPRWRIFQQGITILNEKASQPPSIKLEPRLSGLAKSATLAINERSQALAAQGHPVVKLGLGQSPFPVPRIMVDALVANAHQKAYLPVQGLMELREAVSGYVQRTQHLDYSAGQVLVGPGSKELLFHLQLACDAELLLPSPSWVSYAPQSRILGRQMQWLPSQADDPDLDPDVLDRYCRQQGARPRLLVLNYPNNPSGSTLDADRLEAIACVAREHHVMILSDEIYSGLHFDDDHVSIARYYPEGTIISNGISKWAGAGGWRLGVFVFPGSLDPVLKSMVTLASESYTSVSAPIQYAAIQAFTDSTEMRDYLDQCRRLSKALMQWSWRTLTDAGARAAPPRGGFYLMPHLEGLRDRLDIQSSQALCDFLLETTGVAALPGTAFGRPPDELSLRLACVDFDGAAALEALRALPSGNDPDQALLAQVCQPTFAGIQRVAACLQGSHQAPSPPTR
jgi:aspartate aminotransferase